MKTKQVREHMLTQFATVGPEVAVIVALRELLKHQQSAVPVVDDNGELVGLLSEADCMHGMLLDGYFDQVGAIVGEQMSTEVQTVAPDANLVTVAQLFHDNKRRLVPVVERGKIVGVLTRRNILEALLYEIDHPSHH